MRIKHLAQRREKSCFHHLLVGFRARDVNQEQIIRRVTEASENKLQEGREKLNSPTSASTDCVSYRFESFKQEEKAGPCWFILLEASYSQRCSEFI